MAEFISKRGQAIANRSSYRNTDTVESQHTTHRDILKFGNKIYERKCAELERLKEESLAELEVRLWQIANEERDQAVKETFEQSEQELKQSQENAKKEKEKAVRAECRRVEAYMKKQAQQQLEEAHDTFQLQLREAIHDARIEFEVEKMLATRVAREDEINLAVEEAARTAEMEETKRKKIILEAEKEKAQALKKLKLKMEWQERNNIAEAEERCHQISLEELRKCEEAHLAEMDKLREKLAQQDLEYENMKHQLSQKENIRKKTETKLREVVAEFQKFIDLTKGFSQGQSEFLLPDVNLLHDMLSGAVSSCRK